MKINKTQISILAAIGIAGLAMACGDDDGDSAPTPTSAMVRVIHASHDGPAVDVAIDGAIAISGLTFGKSSGYATVPPGTRRITVTAGGSTLIDSSVTLMPAQDYTVIAVNQAKSLEAVVGNDTRAPSAGKAKVRFLHAAFDAPAVDVKAGKSDGPAVFENIDFKRLTDYVEVDAGSYKFVVTPAGKTDVVVAFDPATLEAGKVYTVMAKGTLAAADMYPFIVRVFVDNDTGTGSLDLSPVKPATPMARVMVIHASPDAPGVDLLINDKRINKAPLKFPANTGYLSLDAGKKTNVKVNVAGTSTTAIEADLTFTKDASYSLFAVDRVAKIAPLLLTDNLSKPAKGKAHVRFIHLSPDAPAVDIAVKNGPTLFSDIAFKKNSKFTPVAAGTYDLDVKVSSSKTTALSVKGLKLADGMIYTIWARGLLSNTTLGAAVISHQ